MTRPQATDDSAIVANNAALTGNVLSNDTDIDGDTLTVVAVNGDAQAVGNTITLPSGATLTLLADGTFGYSPNDAFDGLALGETALDSYTYTVVGDPGGATSTAMVVITIVGQNAPPVAGDDYVRTPVGQPIAIPVLTNDVDANGDPLSVIIIDPPANGTAVVNPNGTITFSPSLSFQGVTSFTYLVEDGHGGTSLATVTVEVFPPYNWNSFVDFSNSHGSPLFAPWIGRAQPQLSREIFSLAPEPIFSGYARPGARIVGKIYDEHGTLVGQAFATADPGGNWMMQFPGVPRHEHYRVDFDFVVESADMYGYLGLNTSDDTYQAMQPWTEWDEALSVSRVMRTTPELSIERIHRENLRPLGIGSRDE